ncbi:hypothetical protein EAF04_003239 [Stromatinia cepivora]|nr:hypothetical protein EAF04_003239 [Stromatinia cepivora]
MVITANPHPTMVPSPTDPKLNSKTTSWKSGEPPTTTIPRGVKGVACGSGCPFCPPIVFGSDGPSAVMMALLPRRKANRALRRSRQPDYSSLILQTSSPLHNADLVVLSSIYLARESEWDSIFSVTMGITTSTSTIVLVSIVPILDVTVTVTPTASTDFAFWDDTVAYQFEIYNVVGWAAHGGGFLGAQENSCGALTGWGWVPASATTNTYVHLYLPTIMKFGCVERAIVSAGGPNISCIGGGGAWGSRDF